MHGHGDWELGDAGSLKTNGRGRPAKTGLHPQTTDRLVHNPPNHPHHTKPAPRAVAVGLSASAAPAPALWGVFATPNQAIGKQLNALKSPKIGSVLLSFQRGRGCRSPMHRFRLASVSSRNLACPSSFCRSKGGGSLLVPVWSNPLSRKPRCPCPCRWLLGKGSPNQEGEEKKKKKKKQPKDRGDQIG